MKSKLFSAFAAAELLQRDRQTITRAMRNVPPDGKEKNQPRWKMSTIFAAMETHNRANDNGISYTNGSAAANANPPPEYAAFDAAFAALEALPTVEARRKRAVGIMPQLHAMVAALTRQGASAGEHPDHTSLRGSEVYRLSMIGFRLPCQWSHDEVWKNLNSVGFNEDGEAVA
jgi:hypothetical protein